MTATGIETEDAAIVLQKEGTKLASSEKIPYLRKRHNFKLAKTNPHNGEWDNHDQRKEIPCRRKSRFESLKKLGQFSDFCDMGEESLDLVRYVTDQRRRLVIGCKRG